MDLIKLFQRKHFGHRYLLHQDVRWLFLLALVNQVVSTPPIITNEPDHEIAYKRTDDITLECKADGIPQPRYEWTLNGEKLEIDGLEVVKNIDGGTITIKEASNEDEGVYQCSATNSFGKAFSYGTIVRQTFIEAFSNTGVRRKEVEEGSYMKLTCNPPKSFPTSEVYWAISRADDQAKISALVYDERVNQDSEGNLHFANAMVNETLYYKCVAPHGDSLTTGPLNIVEVKLKQGNLHFAYTNLNDSSEESRYVCVSFNFVMKSIVQGDYQQVNIREDKGGVFPRVPTLKWNSDKDAVAIQGFKNFKMKCIFDGYPAPTVHWKYNGGSLPPHITMDKTKTEIVIPEVDYSDEGDYTCYGENEVDKSEEKTLKLTVNSRPYWITQPEDINSPEEDDAEFICEARAIPDPIITWYQNGIPFSELENDPRITFPGNKVVFKNLKKSDAQVLQCNASNAYGYIFSNAYLNVLAEPPSFVVAPQEETTIAEGQNINITCNVFGAPKPVLTWKYEGEVIDLSDNRFSQHRKGNLTITNALSEDSGTYTCHAINKLGEDSAHGRLIVRERTVITLPPKSQIIEAGQDVTFHCNATTDQNEEKKLKITWLADGEEINFEDKPRISLNLVDKSITIQSCQVSDSAEYTCRASNGLDSDEYTATLEVEAPPDPPIGVKVRCRSNSATVSLTPGRENNNEVVEYIIYYNTTFDPPDTFIEVKRLPKGTEKTNLRLSAWAHYSFSAVARNGIGISKRTFGRIECETPESLPFYNPENVCSESRGPNDLVITWDPLPPIKHNAEGFYYIVSHRRVDIEGQQEIHHKVTDWTTSELTIGGQETFKKYEVYVQSHNNAGPSPPGALVRKYVFSGEDTPKESPKNFNLQEESLNATSAIFFWDPVDESPEKINGHFKGYRIKFWRTNDKENPKIQDVILRSSDPCPMVAKDKRKKRQSDGGPVSYHVMDLWPYSQIEAGVMVLNGGQTGNLGDTIQFETPEAPPGVVGGLEVVQRGSHHLKVMWIPPSEPNGRILGYYIGHQKDGTGPITPKLVDNLVRRHTKIMNLTEDTQYRIYIWAVTAAGEGKRYYVESSTKPSGPPDIPAIADIEPGDDYLKVFWQPSEEGQEENPGSSFYIEYKQIGNEGEVTDNGDWLKKEPQNEDEEFANVTGLEYGDQYEIRVVAANGHGQESRSETKIVRVGHNEERVVQSIATAGWFIGLLCAILFLLIIVIIICILKRNRGGKYPVHEKERLRGQDPEKEEPGDGGFGEYARHGGKITTNPLDDFHVFESRNSEDPDYKKSNGSLASEQKPLEGSDSDSMAEYDQMDPSKFNEDGSFIGQYGGKIMDDNTPDIQAPSALSTFV